MTSLNLPTIIIVSLSAMVQFAAAIMAIRLVRLTGKKLAWSLISLALVLMTFRRLMPLYRLMTVPTGISADLTNETVGLILSIAMLLGIALIAPLFHERIQTENSLRRMNRELHAISSCHQILTRAKDEQMLLNGICRIICAEAGYRMAWVGYAEHDADKTIRPVAWGGIEDGYLANARISWANTELGQGPSGIAIRTGKPACIQDFMRDPKASPWRQNALKRGYRSSIALPLKDDNATTFGIICIYSITPDAFTPAEIALLEKLTGDLAFGITALRARTQQKQAEELRSQMAAIMESSHDAIIGKTPDGMITHWNKGAERIYEYRADEIIGKPVTVLVPDEQRKQIHALLARIRHGETVVIHETERVRKDGSHTHVALTLSPIKDAAGNITGISAIARDFTEKKRFEEKLRQASIYNRSLIEASLDPLVTISLAGKITDVNRATEQVTGVGRSKLIDTDFSDYFTEPAKARAGYRQAFDQGSVTDYPLAIRHVDGHITHVLYNANVYHDEAGNVLGVFAAARDITERKKAEEQLRRSEHGLAEAQRIAHLGNWELDLVHGVLTWSDEIYRIFEIDPEKFGASYAAFLQRIHPDDREMVDLAYSESVKHKQPYDIVHRLLMDDGRVKYVNEKCETYYDQNGNPIRSTGTVHDITERHTAELELSHMSLRNRLILDAAGEGIYGLDIDGHCTFINPAALKLLGFEADEIIGHHCHPIFHHSLSNGSPYPITECPVQLAYKHGQTHRGKELYWRKDGTSFPVEFVSTPILEDGQLTGAVVMFNDVTERIRAEEELRRYKDHLEEEVQQRTADLVLARNAAEAANQAKSVFLANMSHELRTPLNAILGFSTMMYNDPTLPENLHQNINIINRSGEHLLTLINDVLDMSKIEAGRVQLEQAAFDLGGMIRDVADMMQIRAQEKGLRLLVDQSSRFPRYIVGDEARLRQVLINLLGNAVKFTQQGGVTLRLGTKKNKVSHLIMEIEDSGPGIPLEDQPRIFEPFVQLDEQGSHKGTGLGLSITRQFIEMMGGHLTLDSTPGKGSLFRVELPLDEVMDSEIIKPKQAETGRIIGLEPGQPEFRILIVEDQHDNQLLLTQLMETIGIRPKLAKNGAEAVRLFESWQPDLIWMDRRMPIMNGVDAMRRIRELPGGKQVKIIAVTASAFSEQRAEMLEAGMDDFVRKPYRSHEIYECMAKHLGIRFKYEQYKEAEQPTAELTADRFSALPGELLAELEEALERLDSDRIEQLIQQVACYDPTLQKTLTRLAENFDYPTILKALRPDSDR